MTENPSGPYDACGKVCPLMDLARVVALGAARGLATIKPDAMMCKERYCAWWDDPRQECAILSAAKGRK